MNQETEKLLRADTVSCLVALSGAYSATPGHRVMKHWSRLQASLAASLTGVESIGQWQEAIRSHLHIDVPSNSLCSAMANLESSLADHAVDFYDWLYLVRKELCWFIVQIRLESERRSEERAQQAAEQKMETGASKARRSNKKVNLLA